MIIRADALDLAPEVQLVTMPDPPIPEKEEEAFHQAARGADWALIVAPEFDGILEQRCRWALAAGCRLLGPAPQAIRLTADKWELHRFWEARRIPTPLTWRHTDRAPLPAPWIRKHRFGAGSLDLQLIQDVSAAAPHHLLQQYIPGTPASIGLLITAQGAALPLLPSVQRISSDGAFSYLGGEFCLNENEIARLQALARSAVAAIAGLQAYVGVDAILGEDVDGSLDRAIEINPRITTSYLGLRAMLPRRSSLLKAILAVGLGGEPQPLIWKRNPLRFSADGTLETEPTRNSSQ
jgi:predicted ATP-grasp superfamily ATP-dependent carboligase